MKKSHLVIGALVAPAVAPVAYAVASLLFSGYPFEAPGHFHKFMMGSVAIAVLSCAAWGTVYAILGLAFLAWRRFL